MTIVTDPRRSADTSPGVPRRERLVKFQRVGIGAVQPAPEHVEWAQPGDGAHHQLPVSTARSSPSQQRRSQGSGRCRRARNRCRSAAPASGCRPGFPDRCASPAARRGRRGRTRQGGGPGLRRRVSEKTRAVATRFSSAKPGAGGGLRAVAQHPPAAIRAAPDLEGDEVQVMARCAGRTPTSGRSHSGLPATSAAGRCPSATSRFGAVEIGHHRFQQVGALDQPCGDAVPFGLFDQHRHVAERPGAFGGHRRHRTGGRTRPHRAGTGRRARSGGSVLRASGPTDGRSARARPGGCCPAASSKFVRHARQRR